MDFIKENYHTGYEPKLDIDKYCYYADESNRNIMIELISDYRKNVLGECEPALKNIDKYGQVSFLPYFSHVRLQMYSHILLKG